MFHDERPDEKLGNGNGAGDRIRTGDINLGKVALLPAESYSREGKPAFSAQGRTSIIVARCALRAVKFRAWCKTACTGWTAARNSHIHVALPNVHIDAAGSYSNHFELIVFQLNHSKQWSKK